MKISIVGGKEVAIKLERIREGINRNLRNVIQEGAFLIERDAKASMRGTGTPHVPSMPGQPPTVDTGKLRASITTDVKDIRGRIEAKIGVEGGSEPDSKNYGLFLEFGTSRIDKRPFLFPAFTKNFKAIRNNIARATKSALR